jgi:hypothetical protein
LDGNDSDKTDGVAGIPVVSAESFRASRKAKRPAGMPGRAQGADADYL